VYFYGGGFMAGDGSEPRYDGESMARHGIVAITVNYRLGVFGFLAHPELTSESPFHASGNYGLMDQSAALQWVQQNIAAFGGDPKRITIAGESAGSWSVSAQMASPLSRTLIAGAIAESGALLGGKTASLADAEKAGVKWAEGVQKKSLSELRAMGAEDILKAAGSAGFGAFPVCVDGHFFPQSPQQIFNQGQQAKVPLLAGWNSLEMGPQMILGNGPATVENFRKGVERVHGANAEKILKVYQPATNDEVEQVATDLAGDMFIGFGTWMLAHVHSSNSGKSVYRYFYARPRPQMRPEMGNAQAGLAGGVIRDSTGKAKAPAPPAKGAVHSAEIEYAMGNLPTNRVYDWQPEDFTVSNVLQGYFLNFIKTGNPNGLGLPAWPGFHSQKGAQVMRIDLNSVASPSRVEDRYFMMKELMPK
jgi:para-nitrobenzyl esterase